MHRADLPTAEELDYRAELAAFAATAPPGAPGIGAAAAGTLSAGIVSFCHSLSTPFVVSISFY